MSNNDQTTRDKWLEAVELLGFIEMGFEMGLNGKKINVKALKLAQSELQKFLAKHGIKK